MDCGLVIHRLALEIVHRGIDRNGTIVRLKVVAAFTARVCAYQYCKGRDGGYLMGMSAERREREVEDNGGRLSLDRVCCGEIVGGGQHERPSCSLRAAILRHAQLCSLYDILHAEGSRILASLASRLPLVIGDGHWLVGGQL